MSHTEPRFRPLLDRVHEHLRKERYSFGVTWNYPVSVRSRHLTLLTDHQAAIFSSGAAMTAARFQGNSSARRETG